MKLVESGIRTTERRQYISDGVMASKMAGKMAKKKEDICPICLDYIIIDSTTKKKGQDYIYIYIYICIVIKFR